MSERDDQLIAEFNARRSEAAFAALVQQHVNLVFATAWRQVGDAGAAEEITQNVFVALAQAAGRLGSHPTLAGWLYQTALNKSRVWLRTELRRRRREQVAVDLGLARAEGDSVWAPLVPLLDEALLKLREPDRQAVILYFMEGRSFHEVGSVLGVGEDAARKRVNRCLDQLTDFFRRHGFAVPALTAGAPLFALSAHVAPAGLAASATTAGLAAAHSAASTSTLTLIKGALKIMAWTKAKTAIIVGAGLLLAAGTTTVAVKEIQAHRTYSWQNLPAYGNELDEVAPQVRIVPSKYSTFGECTRKGKILGLGMPARDVIAAAYGVAPAHVLFASDAPAGTFDFIANLPNGNEAALQKEVRKKFGLIGRTEVRETDALLLKVKNTAKLQAHVFKGNPGFMVQRGLQYGDDPLSSVAAGVELLFEKPVVDATGMSGNYHLQFLANEFSGNEIKWSLIEAQIDSLRQTLVEELAQVGLELVPTNMPMKMLVVEKAK